MIERELYDQYIQNNYKLIFSTGYSDRNTETDEGKRYKAAKKPIEKKWNNEGATKSYDDVAAWLGRGGWISAVLPNNVVALDVDNKDQVTVDGKTVSVENPYGLRVKLQALDFLLAGKPYGVHVTDNGRHVIFGCPTPLKANTTYTKSGLKVTYRPGGLSNIICAPSNGRAWERFVPNDQLMDLPTALAPLDMQNKDELTRAIAFQLHFMWKSDILQGNEDIDMAFMALLVKDLHYDIKRACNFFELIYQGEYDRHKTELNFKVAAERDNVLKAGSFWKACHDKMLNDLVGLVNHLILLEGKENKFNKKKEDKLSNQEKNGFAFDYAMKNNVIYTPSGYYQKDLKEGFYRSITEEDIGKPIADWLGTEHFTIPSIRTMIMFIQKKFYEKPELSFTQFLMADNNVFDTETFTVRPLADNDIFFYKLKVKYDLEAKCPRWLQFLREIFPDNPDDHIDFLQQFIGYIFYPQNKYELSLFLRGEGENGKSVLMDVISYIVGEENKSSVTLSQLKEKFMPIELKNKLLNMSAESENKVLVDDSILKRAVSGESITADVKNKKADKFSPFCKFIFSSNNPINSSDKSYGYERRILFLHFNVDFKNRPDKDPDLRQKLYAEADGIFMWALEGLKRVLKQNKIKISDPLAIRSQEEHQSTNPIYEFASQYWFYSSYFDDKATSTELYNEYKKFCMMNNHQILANNNFFRNIRRVVKFNMITMQRRVGSKTGYYHTKLKKVPFNTLTKQYEPEDDEAIDARKHSPVTDMTFEEFMKTQKEEF